MPEIVYLFEAFDKFDRKILTALYLKEGDAFDCLYDQLEIWQTSVDRVFRSDSGKYMSLLKNGVTVTIEAHEIY